MALLVLLKTAQRLGNFVALSDVPPPILTHIRQCANIPSRAAKILVPYDQSGARQRILKLIQMYMGSNPFTAGGERFIQHMADTAAETKHKIADIINSFGRPSGSTAVPASRFSSETLYQLLKTDS